MKKILATICAFLIFAQNSMASQLYFIQNPSKTDVMNIVESSYLNNYYTLHKKNPYYGVSKKNSSNYATILLQDDGSGLYYYFDGDDKINKYILKSLKNKSYKYSEINTRLKDSFDNMASEQIFGKKITYDFNNENIITQNTSNDDYTRRNYQAPIENSNTIYGYIGQVAAGTEISAYLKDPLNTETIKKGNTVTLVLSKDLVYNGSIVAPQGSTVEGIVTQANSAGFANRNGRIVIDFNKLVLANGKFYNISTEKIDFKVESNEKSSGVAAKIIVGAASTALMALLFASLGNSVHIGKATAIGAGVGAAGVAIAQGAKKGVDAEIPAYTEINLILTQPLGVTKN